MLKKGGIYKIKDTDTYIIIIEKLAVTYYYNVLTGCINSMSNDEIKENLITQIKYGLETQHKFFANEKESKIEDFVDGYLGQITDEQLFSLSVELSFVDFSKNKKD